MKAQAAVVHSAEKMYCTGVLLVIPGKKWYCRFGLIVGNIQEKKAKLKTGEINEYRRTQNIRLIRIIPVVISIVLAVLLMINPFGHFVTHIRILGLEMIAMSFVKGKTQIRKKYADRR